MTYRLKEISPSVCIITEDRKTVGHVKREGQDWVATMNAFRVTAPTAAAAFYELMRVRRETFAKQKGFGSFAEELAARNRKVKEEVAQKNAILTSLGLAPAWRVRRRRIRI